MVRSAHCKLEIREALSFTDATTSHIDSDCTDDYEINLKPKVKITFKRELETLRNTQKSSLP